jgi:Trk-type K+ transport system membrane component
LDDPRHETEARRTPAAVARSPATPAPPLGRRDDPETGPGWLVAAYLAMTFLGFLVFHYGGVTTRGHELGGARSVFMAVNAATCTGFQSTVGVEDLDERGLLGPATVLVLTVGGALFGMVAGGMAVVRILRLPYTDNQVALAGLAAMLIAVLAGATPLLAQDRRMFDAVFQAASAFSNSGLTVGRLSGPSSVLTHAVLLPLAFAGGLGLTVLMELFDRVTRVSQRVSDHARTVLASAAAIYLVATLAFTLALLPRRTYPAGAESPQWRQAVASGSVAAVNSRTAGLPFEYAGAYPRAMQWMLIALMAVGANPAGSGGGIKATAVVQLAGGVRSALRGAAVPRAFGVAAVWLGVYSAIVFAGLLLLLWRAPDLSADRLLFLTVSAASNVGLSHDPISMTGPGVYTLCAVMLAGRIAPVFVLWWMARTTRDAEVAVA